MILTITIAVVASLVACGLLHFLTRIHLLRAAEVKSAHLQCSFCPCVVARYRQLPDSRIQCANCQRKAEK